jgi:ATP-dependent Clp protease ATP-binding subunit ClpA
VLLLDEIEKAHPDLFNVLLQIMDHGKLTDHNGKQVDFRNVILIMTTNAGASDLARAAYGFTQNKRQGDDLEAINKLFAPEFRNRLDATITFAHLSPEIIKQVVEKFVLQLEAQLGDRNVTIELSEEASRWLIANGYDELMGARPMARVIQEHIKKPLADEVLFGKLKGGGHVRVIVDKDENGRDKLGFEFLDGPVAPKADKLPAVRPKAKRRSPRPRPKGSDGKRGSVPKVPLVKA